MPEPDETQHRDELNRNLEATAAGADSGVSPLSPEFSVSPNSIEGLFLRALQLPSPADQEAFLDRTCHDDPESRKRVLALLRAHAAAGDFLESPAVDRPANDKVSLRFLKPSDKDGVFGTIGPYEVLEAIGRGGMGVVLRAFDPKLNRIVAVKALLPELASNPSSRRRFLREAQAAAAISHPHVVSIHAVDDSDQDHDGTPAPPFLVMECIVGQSLQQKLDKVGPLRLTEILRISRQIADGLAAAHKQGLVHRDIKPANILLENGVERVKITDFGLARAIDDITVTRTGEVCGTPQYMSPEQACGDRVDHRSDLFSLGCVMYAMCTGHSPFRGDSVAHVIKRVTQDEPRSIADQNPEIPHWLIEIINSLLQKKAEHRFQSAEDLAVILDQHLSRIQHPSESGSHSAINEQVPYRKRTASQQDAGSDSSSVPGTSPLSFLDRSSQVVVPRWLRSTSRVFAIVCIIGWILFGVTAMEGHLGIGSAEFFILSFLNLGPFLMAVLLSRPTISREVLAIALFLGMGPLGLLIFLLIKDQLRRTDNPLENVTPRTSEPGGSSPVTATTPEHVLMRFGEISMPVPLETALHYRTVKSIGLAWVLLTLVGVVLSLVVHPTLSLAANSTQLIIQAFQYPAAMVGIWIISLFGTKIFTPNVPLRTWALLSSTMLGCMAFGLFWTTVVRMPFSGNLNEISSRSLMGAAILPTFIFLMYCSWVYLEIIKNPETLRGDRTLTGPQARLSTRTLTVLVTTVLLVLGAISLLFKIGAESSSKRPTPPTAEVRKEGSDQSESKSGTTWKNHRDPSVDSSP
jgi:serine/threonine protein kinase